AGMATERAAPTGIEISVEHGAAPSCMGESCSDARRHAAVKRRGQVRLSSVRLHLQGICRLREDGARNRPAAGGARSFCCLCSVFAAKPSASRIALQRTYVPNLFATMHLTVHRSWPTFCIKEIDHDDAAEEHRAPLLSRRRSRADHA